MENLAEFNSHENSRGEIYRALVADANACGEGVSFLAVRTLHLTDVPHTHGDVVQRCARCVRLYSHSMLPEAERRVRVCMYVGICDGTRTDVSHNFSFPCACSPHFQTRPSLFATQKGS